MTLIVIDTVYEDALERFVKARVGVEIVRDPRDELGEVPFYDPNGNVLLSCTAGVDARAVADELQRQQRTMLVVVSVGERD